MPVKVIWDYTFYWGVMCPLFIQNRLTDLPRMGRLQAQLAAIERLNVAVQSFLRAWSRVSGRDAQSAPGCWIRPRCRWFAELNRGLTDKLDGRAVRCADARVGQAAGRARGGDRRAGDRRHPELDAAAVLALLPAGTAPGNRLFPEPAAHDARPADPQRRYWHMDKRQLGRSGACGGAALLRRQRLRLDGRRGDLVRAARRLRRRRLQLHRHRRRLLPLGAGQPGRRVRDDHRQLAAAAAAAATRSSSPPRSAWTWGPATRACQGRYIIRASVEASLQRLQTDHIDLYQSHQDDPETPLEETLRGLRATWSRRARSGRSARRTTAPPGSPRRWRPASGRPAALRVLQPHYNLYDRARLRGGAGAAVPAKQGLGVIRYYSLASGFLTGKYRSRGRLRQEPARRRMKKYLNDRGLAHPRGARRGRRGASARRRRRSRSPGSSPGRA